MKDGMRPQTRIVHAGSHSEKQKGAVNPPVYRASTVIFPTVAAMREAIEKIGRHTTELHTQA